MNSASPDAQPEAAPRQSPGSDVPFGVNEVRLTPRQWLVALTLLVLIALVTPPLWERIERFETGADYRIPYPLSRDYWLYGRRLSDVAAANKVIVLGDSVVWGEYVAPEGTLSHFLNRMAGETNRFINAGVNGLFPLALEGLVEYYGQALRREKVILHGNLLWMTSPKADLSTDKEEQFNHARLAPQFFPRVPCYRADATERLSALIERHFTFFSWVSHVQDAYFGQKSILKWTLAPEGGTPPRYPNAYCNPLSQITLRVPTAPADDPERGPHSPRHKPWSTNATGTTHFEWVGLGTSLQWQAFQRVVTRLRARGNDVLVIWGPFNEHIMAEENRPAFRRLRAGIADWLSENQVPCLLPETLPSALYADASHPLTAGYELLAERLWGEERLQQWLRAP